MDCSRSGRVSGDGRVVRGSSQLLELRTELRAGHGSTRRTTSVTSADGRKRRSTHERCSFRVDPSVRPTMPALSLSREAVAYIDGSVKRSASRRLICLGDLPEALRTAHFASPL